MANCCIADITLMRDEGGLEDKAIIKRLEAALAGIDYCGSGAITLHSDTVVEWAGHTAWDLPDRELQEIAKEFGVRIRAVGREMGCGFVMVSCIDEGGHLLQDDAITLLV